eukprot:TRINITY_DN78784_c0_g1_i1.p1 TRINITY_DN78784_c0_g1~~TRINITY_DN78784_c0_g1_i1.p1  ORF type:complete len:460 (+),score=97.28 TRINITY_DN78784_c0_g1_i1:138-1517(+)
MDSQTQKLKNIFRQYDADCNGTINRQELDTLLRHMMPENKPMSTEEVDVLFNALDCNGTCELEYDALIDWVMQPSSVLCPRNGELKYFDLAEALRPLFEIYDMNGDGFISRAEFVHCHGILQNAIAAESSDIPPSIKGDLGLRYQKLDTNNDHTITFEDFVDWQRSSLAESGLTETQMAKLIKNVAKQMQRVMKYDELHQQGLLRDSDKIVLLRVLHNLATFSKDLWNNKKSAAPKEERHTYKNSYAAPPVGINVDNLKNIILESVPLRKGKRIKLEEIVMQVLCVPAIPTNGTEERPWLASVNLVADAGASVGEPAFAEREEYYIYDREFRTWHWLEDGKSRFRESLDGLSKEVQLFCILKTFANFGIKMSWPSLQDALRAAQTYKIITKRNHNEYNQNVEGIVRRSFIDEGFGRVNAKKVTDLLEKEMTFALSEVMVTFADMGIFKMSSVWADFMDT